MAARVIKLAQQGYNVEDAGDENLVYSSLWPLLKIYKSGPFTISDVTQDQLIATHDLGYTPMFWFFTNDTIDSWLNSGAIKSDNRSEFFGSLGGGSLTISANQLFYSNNFTGSTSSLNGYYYIFANDITTQFTAPITNAGAQPAGRSNNRIFKVAKPGKDISSKDLQDFAIHSDTRSPLIHSINPGKVSPDPNVAGGNSFTVYHNLGYIPMFFGYTYSNGVYSMLPTGSGGSTIFTADTQKVQFQESVSGRQMTIVILKDPFLIDYSVSVTVWQMYLRYRYQAMTPKVPELDSYQLTHSILVLRFQ